jgi:hypothetical protein
VPQETLIEYLQHVLDAESNEWVLEKVSSRVKVAHFRDRPLAQSNTSITIGLSHYLLHLGGGEETRQELVLCAYSRFELQKLVTFLLLFSEFLIKEHDALRRGQVIFPPDRLLPESQMEAIYTTSPVRLGECFASLEKPVKGIEFLGLLPLYASEVKYLRKFGSQQFGKLLDAEGENTLDLIRDPWT